MNDLKNIDNPRDLEFNPKDLEELHPEWIAGFIASAGCFHISISKTKTIQSVKVQVLPDFSVVQHKSNKKILYALQARFKCGIIRRNYKDYFVYRVRKREDLLNKIIPFFQKYPLHTKKAEDFKNFCKVLNMMKEKKHLTEAGLQKIKEIKVGMNKYSQK